jgi:PIN domain nuclease of toxin-antitoxin system
MVARPSVSAVTPWELGAKAARGKLQMRAAVADIVRMSDFTPLAIRWDHAEAAARLPWHHRDPFDRMLVAQAQLEGLSIVSDDADLARYQVHVVPATA